MAEGGETKKKCLTCPVCDCMVLDGDISAHVNSHFEEEEKCQYEGCSAVMLKGALEDHLIAHGINQDHREEPPDLNDSALAVLLQNEECEKNVESHSAVSSLQDHLLARKIQQEEKYRQEAKEFMKLQDKYGMSSTGGYMKQYDDKMEKKVGKDVSVGDYFKQKTNLLSTLIEGDDCCSTRTQDILPVIASVYQEHLKKKTCYLCSDLDHFGSSLPDQGWGCGYRNCQMLLSSFLKNRIYKDVLKSTLQGDNIPSIPRLQELIEKAWKAGYDSAGCEQLGGKLRGTRKWIGTTEIAALFRWMKLRARIVDFHKPSGEGRTHPKMFEWIQNFFRNKLKADCHFPLYLQHQGHSRTCIGVERNNTDDTIALLIFDPSYSKGKLECIKATAKDRKTLGSIQCFKKTIKQMKYDQFQVLFIDGIYKENQDIQESKLITSIRVS